jgi:hypothetical protein
MEQTDSGVKATIVRNENVDEFILRHEDGTEQRSTKSIGSFTYDNGDGEYTLIAVVGGNEEVIRSTTVVGAESGESSSADSVSGTVSYNSPAEGVLVESYDSEGNLVDSDLTNANGVYTVKEADELRVNGFTASYGDVNLCTVASNEGTSVPSLLMDGDGSSSSPYEISTASDLQAMQEDLNANYIVVNDINASCTVNWNNGQGFDPVGTSDFYQDNLEFTGSFDGQNHTISNLSINRLYDNYVGLFGAIGAGGEVKNVGVINVNITVESNDVGGLVGYNEEGNILNSYSTGNVTGEYDVGGLVGENWDGNISNSYSTGNVSGELHNVGGLVGRNYNGGTVSNSYSTGNVTGDNKVGGLVGYNFGDVSNSYWNSDSTITENSTDVSTDNTKAGVPLTTSQMQGSSASSNMNFEFTSTWSTVTGDYPELQWQE